MNDSVSRYDAIDASLEFLVEYLGGAFDEELQKMLKAKLENLPSVNQWISVSERLPKVGEKVLVTSYGRVCYAVMNSTDGHNGYPIFRLQDSLKEKTVCETIAHNDMTTSRIIAWMPLPEPWEGEKDD